MEHASNECANCGATEDLLRCARCRKEWFCSVACQKAYYPFHRDACKKNEFADALEPTEPRLAAWMRQHGKLAVLKDDEVERLERASNACCASTGRSEVLESMYGRLDPKPKAPTYSMEDKLAMEARQEADKRMARMMSKQDQQWAALGVPEGLGLECSRYKFRQSLSHVEVFVRVPPGIQPKKVRVALSTTQLSVSMGADPGHWDIHCELYGEVQNHHSTWFIADGILHISLLKRNRKGHYQPGSTNADTWWRSLMAKAGPLEAIPLKNPPTRYYWLEYEEDDLQPEQEAKPLALTRPAAAQIAAAQ